MQFLSEKMSRHLSSLAPGFEGHWAYVESLMDGKKQIICAFKRYSWRWANDYKFICPAWQVEDVLRNLKAIGEKLNWGWVCGDCGHERPRKAEPGDVRCDCDDPWYSWPQKYSNRAGEILAGYLHDHPDTYYQKIEEYLWTVLK